MPTQKKTFFIFALILVFGIMLSPASAQEVRGKSSENELKKMILKDSDNSYKHLGTQFKKNKLTLIVLYRGVW